MFALHGQPDDFVALGPTAHGPWFNAGSGAVPDGIRRLVAMIRSRYAVARLDGCQLVDPLAGRYRLVPRGGEAQTRRERGHSG